MSHSPVFLTFPTITRLKKTLLISAVVCSLMFCCFVKFVHGNHKAQKYLLGAFELLVGQSFPGELMPKAAHILKAFYDADLLEEEVILQWSEKVNQSTASFQVLLSIFPFLWYILFFFIGSHNELLSVLSILIFFYLRFPRSMLVRRCALRYMQR